MADQTFEKNLDTLMKIALLKSIVGGEKEIEVVPFAAEIVCTPNKISGHCKGNRKMLEDIEGADEWYKETCNLISGILIEQTTKLGKLMEKRYGIKISEDSSK